MKKGLEDGLETIYFIYERYSEKHNWSAGFPSAHVLWCRPFRIHFKVWFGPVLAPLSLSHNAGREGSGTIVCARQHAQ